jgi:hypothetical protein
LHRSCSHNQRDSTAKRLERGEADAKRAFTQPAHVNVAQHNSGAGFVVVLVRARIGRRSLFTLELVSIIFPKPPQPLGAFDGLGSAHRIRLTENRMVEAQDAVATGVASDWQRRRVDDDRLIVSVGRRVAHLRRCTSIADPQLASEYDDRLRGLAVGTPLVGLRLRLGVRRVGRMIRVFRMVGLVGLVLFVRHRRLLGDFPGRGRDLMQLLHGRGRIGRHPRR